MKVLYFLNAVVYSIIKGQTSSICFKDKKYHLKNYKLFEINLLFKTQILQTEYSFNKAIRNIQRNKYLVFSGFIEFHTSKFGYYTDAINLAP